MDITQTVSRIDWELLAKQKEDLLFTINYYVPAPCHCTESLVGILHLLDALEDAHRLEERRAGRLV